MPTLQYLTPRRVAGAGGAALVGSGAIVADNSLSRAEDPLSNYGGTSKKNPGKVVGIVMGIVGGILILTLLGFWYFHRKKKEHAAYQEAVMRGKRVVVSESGTRERMRRVKRMLGMKTGDGVYREREFGGDAGRREACEGRQMKTEGLRDENGFCETRLEKERMYQDWDSGVGEVPKTKVERGAEEVDKGGLGTPVVVVRVPEKAALPAYRSLLPPVDQEEKK